MDLDYPKDFKYTDTHEYVSADGEIAIYGITAFAVSQLGDIVFVELPEVGATLEKGNPCGTIESVKAVEELYAPVSGTVIERNEAMIDDPEGIANDPQGDGWLLKIRFQDSSELEGLLTAERYSSLVAGQ